MKIGAIAVIPAGDGKFWGLECPKGRGLILPGGKYEKSDTSYAHTAAREAYEEIGALLNPYRLRYLWHGPDGGDFICFAFLANLVTFPDDGPELEATPQKVTWSQLSMSEFGPYYRILKEIYFRA